MKRHEVKKLEIGAHVSIKMPAAPFTPGERWQTLHIQNDNDLKLAQFWADNYPRKIKLIKQS